MMRDVGRANVRRVAVLAIGARMDRHGAAQSGAQNAPLRALSSNGVRAGLEAVVPQCERSAGRAIELEFGTSASIRQRMSGGESVDLAFITTPVVAELAAGWASRRKLDHARGACRHRCRHSRGRSPARDRHGRRDQAGVARGAFGHVCPRRREPPAPRAHVRAARDCGRDASKDAARAGLRAGGGKSRRRRGGDLVDARQRDLARRGHGARRAAACRVPELHYLRRCGRLARQGCRRGTRVHRVRRGSGS